MKPCLSFFESGRGILTQPGKKILIFTAGKGITASIQSAGFDVDEVQAAMNMAASLHNGISWDTALQPVSDS